MSTPVENDRSHGGVSLLVVAGVVALLGAVAVYGRENSSVGDPDYTFAFVLVGVAGFLFVIAAIISNGRRNG